MADTTTSAGTTRTTEATTAAARARAGVTAPEPTGWVGWNVFAAVMLMIGGALQAFYGFVAVVNDEWVVWGNRGSLYVDLTAWGWIHMVIGVIVLLAGIGVLSGNVLARAVGVVVAAASIIANFMFLPAYPIWSITVIAIDVLVIWALTAHGAEMRRSRYAEPDIDLR